MPINSSTFWIKFTLLWSALVFVRNAKLFARLKFFQLIAICLSLCPHEFSFVFRTIFRFSFSLCVCANRILFRLISFVCCVVAICIALEFTLAAEKFVEFLFSVLSLNSHYQCNNNFPAVFFLRHDISHKINFLLLAIYVSLAHICGGSVWVLLPIRKFCTLTMNVDTCTILSFGDLSIRFDLFTTLAVKLYDFGALLSNFAIFSLLFFLVFEFPLFTLWTFNVQTLRSRCQLKWQRPNWIWKSKIQPRTMLLWL